jgi:ATP/ADP translocase
MISSYHCVLLGMFVLLYALFSLVVLYCCVSIHQSQYSIQQILLSKCNCNMFVPTSQ